jgi:hypothetical protein
LQNIFHYFCFWTKDRRTKLDSASDWVDQQAALFEKSLREKLDASPEIIAVYSICVIFSSDILFVLVVSKRRRICRKDKRKV